MTDKRAAANRQNALKSTGPQTTAGKLTVAGNGIAHGIYAVSPVVAGVESSREWNIYRMEMFASFAPLGMLETTLAERIILTAWRQRRVARYESEHLRSEQQAAQECVGKDWLHQQGQYNRDDGAEVVEHVSRRFKWWDRWWPSVELLTEGSEETEMDKQAAGVVLYLFRDKLRVPDAAGKDDQQLQDPERWTVGLLRQRIRLLVEKHGKGRASLDSLLEKIKEDAVEARRDAEQVKQRLNEYRHEHLLPDERTLEKVMRYETHLSRLLHRDLHELQRLQEMRQGRFAPAPVAIDIDGASSPKTGSENGV
jgi:hypothetical protein